MATCTAPTEVIQMLTPHILGDEFNWTLYGVLIVQLYTYHVAPFTDPLFVKSVVYVTFIVETIQTAMAAHDAQEVLVYSWGCMDRLFLVYTETLSEIILPSLIGTIVECFYAWRIYVISNSLWQGLLVATLSLAQLGAALFTGIQLSITVGSDTSKASELLRYVTIWSVMMTLCDTIIFVLMAYHLSRRRTGIKTTDKLIDGLVRAIVETGMASAVTWIVFLTLFWAFKSNHYYVTPALVGSKIYSNSLLVILNNRRNNTDPRLVSLSLHPRERLQATGTEINWASSYSNPVSTEDRVIMVDFRTPAQVNKDTETTDIATNDSISRP